ncbi:MAG: hypothetical protein NZ651_07100 [Candidatus Bipolaricaulota bacterium]|nr:hypothetical protein [Candidatus Bipolaricaulota bacterium]MDW8127520.1 hypothetical protein [Candidatus Bipolaricaulota bacterium]
MRVVLDSDGLIKLYKAGILEKILDLWEVLVPAAVYEETVQRGIEEAYPEAEALGRLIVGRVRVPPKDPRAQRILRTARSLGRGERETLHLFFAEGAEGIVSDDRAFLGFLRRHALPGLPPALAVARLVEEERLNKKEALAALERMRGLVREEVYWRARARIEGGGG